MYFCKDSIYLKYLQFFAGGKKPRMLHIFFLLITATIHKINGNFYGYSVRLSAHSAALRNKDKVTTQLCYY